MFNPKTAILFLGLALAGSPAMKAQEHPTLAANLQKLYDLADQNNRVLKLLQNNEAIAEKAIQVEKDKLLPSLEATLALSYISNGYITDRDFSNGFSVDIPSFGNSFIVEAKQLIYAGGAVNKAIELAKTNKEISALKTKQTQQDIRFMITSYYLEIMKMQNQLQIVEKNKEQTLKVKDQIKARYKEGVALKNNITRYDLLLQNLDLTILKLNNGISILKSELLNALQLPKGTNLNLEQENLFSEELQLNDTDWESFALENAPSLKESGLQIAQAEKASELVKTDSLPQVFAFAGNYLNGPVMIEIPVLDNNFNYWNVGVGIKYNISSLFKNKSKEEQTKLGIISAQEHDAIVKDDLKVKVEAAQIRLSESINSYQTHLKGVELATENYTIVKNRFLNDMALMTEMLDADNTKLDSEMQTANSKINILFQYYQLKKLTGTL